MLYNKQITTTKIKCHTNIHETINDVYNLQKDFFSQIYGLLKIINAALLDNNRLLEQQTIKVDMIKLISGIQKLINIKHKLNIMLQSDN